MDPSDAKNEKVLAEIEKLRAETRAIDLESRRQQGWRAFIKPVLGAFLTVSAGLATWDYVVKLRVENAEEQREIAKAKVEQLTEQANGLTAAIEAREAAVNMYKAEVIKKDGEARAVRDAYEVQVNQLTKVANDLRREAVRTHGENAKLDAALKAVDQSASRLSATPASPSVTEVPVVVANAKAASGSKAADILTGVLKQYSNRPDMRLASQMSEADLVKLRTSAKLPLDEKILAGIYFVFGERIVFTDQRIRFKRVPGDDFDLPYNDLPGRKIVALGKWNVELGFSVPMSLAGTSFAGKDLAALLEELQKVVEKSPDAFSNSKQSVIVIPDGKSDKTIAAA